MKKNSVIALCALLAVAATLTAIWGIARIRRQDGAEKPVYTESEYAQLQAEYEKASDQLANYTARYESAARLLATARQELNSRQDALDQLTGELASANASAESAQKEAADSKAAMEAAQKDAAESKSAMEAAQKETADSIAAMEAAQKEAADAKANMEAAQKDAAESKSAMEAAQKEAADAIADAQAAIEAWRRFESVSMPLGFILPEDSGAAEVGGWVYISVKDGTAQAALRELESEEDVTRADIVEYLMSLTPQDDAVSPAVEEAEGDGFAYSRFAREYVDEDGQKLYGEFCVLEIGDRFFCLETQARRRSRDSAARLMDDLLAGMYVK